MIKQLAKWRSDIIAQGYIENSMHNRQLIYDGITRGIAATNTHSKPLISIEVTIAHEETGSNYNFEWSDFSEEFTTNSLDPISGKHKKLLLKMKEDYTYATSLIRNFFSGGVVESGFATASSRNVLTPPTNKNKPSSVPSSSKLFSAKPPLEVNFNNKITAHHQPPLFKKRKNLEDSDHQEQNNNNMISALNKNFKFEHRTFNNCVFSITSCKHNKENC